MYDSSIALVLLNIRTARALHELKPLIIRIDDVGRAEAITYESFQYQPREAEIRYFLMDFVQRHYTVYGPPFARTMRALSTTWTGGWRMRPSRRTRRPRRSRRFSPLGAMRSKSM